MITLLMPPGKAGGINMITASELVFATSRERLDNLDSTRTAACCGKHEYR